MILLAVTIWTVIGILAASILRAILDFDWFFVILVIILWPFLLIIASIAGIFYIPAYAAMKLGDHIREALKEKPAPKPTRDYEAEYYRRMRESTISAVDSQRLLNRLNVENNQLREQLKAAQRTIREYEGKETTKL